MAAAALPDLLMVAAGVVVLAAVAGVLAAVWIRRRWRRLGLVLAGRVGMAAAGAGRKGVRWALAHPVPDARWWSAARARRQVLRAVAAAEQAVDAARAADAPVGDLPQLARRLRASADAVDASLAVAQRGAWRHDGADGTEEQVHEVLRAAACIHEAAVVALSAGSAHRRAGLVHDAEHELAAISAGARRAVPGPGDDPSDGTAGR